jgi:ABC-type phosphate transport system substrate-binding protein
VRTLKTMVALAAVSLAASVVAAAPALADPPTHHGKIISPRYYDVVGVGADTDDTLLDQLAADYDAAHHKHHNKTHPWIYSWDAVPPNNPNDLTQQIRVKAGCSKILRPDGTGDGLTDFELAAKTRGHDCIDFNRAASSRSSDPLPYAPTGDVYVQLAEDAETWAVDSTTDAPATLTPAQLTAIFSCADTNWSQVGGTSAPIDVVLPAATAGVTKFWLKALGLSSYPTCATTVQQNEGTASVFTNSTTGPEAIVPISVGKFIAQGFHSAKCGHKPTKNQNEFGCDQNGSLQLGQINATTPTVGSGKSTEINIGFDGVFLRPIYDVVWYAVHSKNGDHIPDYLEPFFASAHAKVKGWFCSNKTAQRAITDYGFLTVPTCGFGS